MRQFCQQVFVLLHQTADASVRTIAKVTRIPRSSVHRYRIGIVKRNQYPESHFWEREEGDSVGVRVGVCHGVCVWYHARDWC